MSDNPYLANRPVLKDAYGRAEKAYQRYELLKRQIKLACPNVKEDYDVWAVMQLAPAYLEASKELDAARAKCREIDPGLKLRHEFGGVYFT